jgi:uncharacterized protein involved in exopolysaccharide biosynthesis
VQPANVTFFLNGVSAYLSPTEKEREVRCEIARLTTESYAKKLVECQGRLKRLHHQQQQLLEQVRREESRHNVLKALVERRTAVQAQKEGWVDDLLENELTPCPPKKEGVKRQI